MAHLNLRDRLIETTIAYVGADEGYGATTFAHVARDRQSGRASEVARSEVDGAPIVSLDWRPRDGAKLNDCELAVKLIATDGPLDTDAVRRVLVDADGLVLVLESDPACADRNRHAVATVRSALSRVPSKKMPVVVQVNQIEGAEGGLEPVAVDVEEWPRVNASPKGDGVMETLQRAVDGVVEQMQSEAHREPEQRPAPTARAEGNPLLGALRQILQTTVSEQVATLEARLLGHIDARVRGRDDDAGAWDRRLDSFEAHVEQVAKAVEEVRAGFGSAGDKTASKEDVARLSIRMVEDGAKTDAIVAQVAALAEHLERLESVVVEVGGRAANAAPRATAAELTRVEKALAASLIGTREALMNELKELRRALRDDVVRVVGAIQLMHKGLDALSAEIKKMPTGEAVSRIDATIERVAAKAEAQRGQIDTILAETRTARTDVLGLGSQVRDLETHVAARVTDSSDALRTLGEKIDGRTEAMSTELSALVDDLRKKKKWFG